MSEQPKVKKFWGLLLGLYIVAMLLGGVLTDFPSAVGKMLVPFLVGVGLLRWASSDKSVRNIYICVALLFVYFLFQDYNESRSDVVSEMSYGCVNNNASVDSTATSEQQEKEYCGCMAEELADFMMLRAAQERFSSDDGVLTADDFSKDVGMKARMASAQQICSAQVAG
jgi:hypothetical protein